MRARRVASVAGGALTLTLALSAPAFGDVRDRDPLCPGGIMSSRSGVSPTDGVHAPTRVAGEADYLAGMIPHHQEAVEAAAQLARSDRPEMRALGASVVATQSAEVAQMEAWLREWYPGTAPGTGMPMMRDLGALGGDALDRAFLEDMVPHHLGMGAGMGAGTGVGWR